MAPQRDTLITLARNFATMAEVDRASAARRAAGAILLERPEEVLWEGCSGYRADIDGHVRELAMTPFWTPAPDSTSLMLPEAP